MCALLETLQVGALRAEVGSISGGLRGFRANKDMQLVVVISLMGWDLGFRL